MKCTYLSRLIDKKQTNNVKCHFCNTMLKDPRSLTTCQHLFCKKCVCKFTPVRINADNSNRCPVDECKKAFTKSDIVKLML